MWDIPTLKAPLRTHRTKKYGSFVAFAFDLDLSHKRPRTIE